ncbi:aorsin [Aureobasidium sp. EXF-10728]|nr:aorsin [Aureobasidium sp. EXF-10728]
MLSSLLAGVFVAAALASPIAPSLVAHERRHALPRGWLKTEKVPTGSILPMRIGLAQSNLKKGHDLLMDVSIHNSPNYGKYYTAEQVNEIFAPAKASIDSVMDWLASHNVNGISLSANKQWLQFDAPVEVAEKLFKTDYHVYEHATSGGKNVACDEYHVPEHLSEHIDYITPGIKLFSPARSGHAVNDKNTIEKRTFGVTNGKAAKQPPLLKPLPLAISELLGLAELSLCQMAITPSCIATLYNITQATSAQAGNELGIFEDLGDVYSQTDLNEFFLTLAQQIPVGTHPKLEAIDGAVAPVSVANAGAESDLDFQISYPIIYPQNSILFQTDDPVYENNYTYPGFLNNFLDAIDGSYCSYDGGNSPLDPPYPDPQPGGYKGALQCGVYQPTNVISISYGGQEADLPASYQTRQCNEYMKLGMQGVSIVLASGDSGVAGPAGDDNADGCLGSGQIFSPDFPATCPYITTVGATYLPPNGNVFKDEETAVTRYGSGGGFSNIFEIPSYQAAAVSNYLTNHPPPYTSYSTTNDADIGAGGGIYNRNGRGYPDVSAIGDNVLIFNKGAPTLIGGTSAAAPVFAAILTRINEERLKAGKSTVGFVNPTLYANPGAFHDITTGNNPGCNTNGFSAASGWDPVTGLGTPNYPALLKVFMSI